VVRETEACSKNKKENFGYASGDFQMVHRDDMHVLRGYVEVGCSCAKKISFVFLKLFMICCWAAKYLVCVFKPLHDLFKHFQISKFQNFFSNVFSAQYLCAF
jgi:hypothetical protein